MEENENKKVIESTNDPIKDGGEKSNTPEVPAPVKVKKDRIDIWYEKRVARREAKAAKKAEKKQDPMKKAKAEMIIGAILVIGAVAGNLIGAACRRGNSNHIDGSDLITDTSAEPEVGASCDQTIGSGEEA